ncbi:methyltransferase domain-containing protein [archaeon]|nr:methyltransferase domain-containing protein [archaeon]
MGFDVIGDIVVVKEGTRKQCEELLRKNHAKTVVKKSGEYEGRYRVMPIKIVCGEKKTETAHKENGVEVKLDLRSCYFSPRLQNERMRIAKQVKKGENVLVMFSGVGIYPLVIAKHSLAKKIVGIELNKEAHKYAEENCRRYANIELYQGDVKKIVPLLVKKGIRFDRIIMPLPKTGEKFLDLALKAVKRNGVVHFYDFCNEKDFPGKTINEVKKNCPKLRFKVLNPAKCGQYAPSKFRVCLDFRVG